MVKQPVGGGVPFAPGPDETGPPEKASTSELARSTGRNCSRWGEDALQRSVGCARRPEVIAEARDDFHARPPAPCRSPPECAPASSERGGASRNSESIQYIRNRPQVALSRAPQHGGIEWPGSAALRIVGGLDIEAALRIGEVPRPKGDTSRRRRSPRRRITRDSAFER